MSQYWYCHEHNKLYAIDGGCPDCVEIRECRCGAIYSALVGDPNASCPRCQPAYYRIDGNGVRQIVVNSGGIGNNVNVLVEN